VPMGKGGTIPLPLTDTLDEDEPISTGDDGMLPLPVGETAEEAPEPIGPTPEALLDDEPVPIG